MIDQLIGEIDKAIRTLFPPAQRQSARPCPQAPPKNTYLSQTERKKIAGLMRVNHAGEVCAQALYQGQAITAQLAQVRQQMNQAAEEENDHLAWCEQRLQELNSHSSYLNPFWYTGSLIIGMAAGLAGDKWSLGFVAETEKQVSAHLQNHLQQIPLTDNRSRLILEQMYIDEKQHEDMANKAGAQELPPPIQKLMRLVSKLMTKTSYYL